VVDKKTGTQLPASLFQQDYFRDLILLPHLRVIREMQDVRTATVEVNPTLDVPDAGPALTDTLSVAEPFAGIRRELCRGDAERLAAPGHFVESDCKRSRMTKGYFSETRGRRSHPCCSVCCYRKIFASGTLCSWTDIADASNRIFDDQIGATALSSPAAIETRLLSFVVKSQPKIVRTS